MRVISFTFEEIHYLVNLELAERHPELQGRTTKLVAVCEGPDDDGKLVGFEAHVQEEAQS